MPGASTRSLSFIIYGITQDKAGILIKVDFSGYFPRKCDLPDTVDQPNSDYEFWSVDAKQCSLGEKIVYTRRKAAADCFNGEDYNVVYSKATCECTQLDFECNQCYDKQKNDKGEEICERTQCDIVPISTPPPPNCTKSYFVDNEYRKVQQTKCKGGKELRKEEKCPGEARYIRKITLLMLFGLSMLVLIVCFAVFVYFKNEGFRNYVRSWFPSLFKSTEPDYSALLGDDDDYDSVLDDEAVETTGDKI